MKIRSYNNNSHNFMDLGLSLMDRSTTNDEVQHQPHEIYEEEEDEDCVKSGFPVQLDLLPLRPIPINAIPSSESSPLFSSLSSSSGEEKTRKLDMNEVPFGSATTMDYDNNVSIMWNRKETTEMPIFKAIPLPFPMSLSVDRSMSIDEEQEHNACRKKLRLSKEQSALLEESFRHHSTLNPKQKLELANRLNLSHRQVEVWFQNRRARTKLKQTEMDCEYLKRCCEVLREENKKLKKEVMELRALKVDSPYYMSVPPATLTMCPSCEKVITRSTNTINNTNNANANMSNYSPSSSATNTSMQAKTLVPPSMSNKESVAAL